MRASGTWGEDSSGGGGWGGAGPDCAILSSRLVNIFSFAILNTGHCSLNVQHGSDFLGFCNTFVTLATHIT